MAIDETDRSEEDEDEADAKERSMKRVKLQEGRQGFNMWRSITRVVCLTVNVVDSIVTFWQLCDGSPEGSVTFLQLPCADHAKSAPPLAFATLSTKRQPRSSTEPRSEKRAPPVLCVAPTAELLVKLQFSASITPHIQVYMAP